MASKTGAKRGDEGDAPFAWRKDTPGVNSVLASSKIASTDAALRIRYPFAQAPRSNPGVVESEMADRVVGPLRDFRAPLHDGLRQLQVAAEAIGDAEPRVALSALDAAVEFLANTFMPIAKAEEYTFFIAVDGVIGAVGASQVMVAQHDSIAAMVRDLGKVVGAAHTDSDPAGYARYLVPLLHGLYALIRAHLEAEDDVYLTLLDDALSESQVEMIVKNIGRITAARAGHEAPV